MKDYNDILESLDVEIKRREKHYNEEVFDSEFAMSREYGVDLRDVKIIRSFGLLQQIRGIKDSENKTDPIQELLDSQDEIINLIIELKQIFVLNDVQRDKIFAEHQYRDLPF